MGKIAFVYPGQGAQFSGMGASLRGASPVAAEIFARADALRPGTSEMCFSGDEAELSKTINAQPCMFAVELAAAVALGSFGIRADMTAGFSLGEIAALTCSGAADFETGFRLVTERGALMQRAADAAGGGMCAVVKLDAQTVERLCSAYDHVWPVNYNSPGQTSVAGDPDELSLLAHDVKSAGGRAIPLKVRGAFHSPFMAPAADAFREVVSRAELQKPGVTLYSDCTGEPYDGDFAELLSRQIRSSVRWQTIIENMAREGADTFVELGPSKTLCGLIGRIIPDARVLNVADEESLNTTVKEIKGC